MENFTKEMKSQIRNEIKDYLKPIVNKAIRNKNDNIIATITIKNIDKMISDKAINKSVQNGFSIKEHLEAVRDIKNLFESSLPKSVSDDLKNGDPNLKIHRYNAKFKEANALLTLKETTNGIYQGKRIYSLELEWLE